MRVERIQPDLRQTEGTAISKYSAQEQKKLLEPFMKPLKEENKLLDPFMTPLSQAAQEAKEDQKKGKAYLIEKLEEKVKQLNETVEIFDKRIHFEIHEETERIMVQVIEKETEEIISEIPPEKILDLVARIEEMIGLIIDKKV
ncbi:MAG: flagellar protein FlaG [Firmicutes bacterium]|nr:flagellar protein FlaG [Bacillota bacterium]